MTSVKRIRASQVNGQRSRGPRTLAGKMNSRKNSWRHGLSLINRSDPMRGKGVKEGEREEIIKLICGRDDHPLLFEQAAVVAECTLILRRVSAAKLAAIERSMTASATRDEYAALRASVPELARLDRYERRARGRRKRAILCLSAIRSYLRAIVSDKDRPRSEYDCQTGTYFIKLAEPKWSGQIIDSAF
jgi:hypothetical protein